MRKLYLTLLSTILAVASSGIAIAQDGNFNVDSFFDITYEIDFPNLPDPPLTEECMDCEALLDLIREKEAELGDLIEEAEGVLRDAKDVRDDIKDTKEALENAKKRLDDFSNPKSWAESNGNRITSTDLEIGRAHNRALWEQYQNGNLTAQQLSDAWEQGLTDKEKERLKRKIQKQLEKEVKELENKLKGLEAREKILGGKLKELDEKIAKLKEELAKLWQQYEDCLKRCQEKQKVNLIDDYGFLPEDDEGLFGWFKDFFGGIFRTGPKPIETEIIEMDLKGVSPFPDFPPVGLPLPPSTGQIPTVPPDILNPDFPADSFFDVFVEIELPELPPIPPQPVCAACEELAKKLDAMEAEMKNKEKDVANKVNKLENEKRKLTQAQKELQRAKDALDRFTNPTGWAESGGRRIDTTDLEVMREHNRNLWSQYRNGKLSAKELEEKWEEGLSDKDREMLKKKMKEKLEKEVAKKQKEVDRLSEIVKKLSDEIDADRKKLADMMAEFKKLLAEFEECLKKCIHQAGDLILVDPDDDEADDTSTGLSTGDTDEPENCPPASFPESECDANCFKKGFKGCGMLKKLSNGTECFVCTGGVEEEPCPNGSFPEALCDENCFKKRFGGCGMLKKMPSGVECFVCTGGVDEPDDDEPPPKNICDLPTLLENDCRKECTKGECIYSYTNQAGGKCFTCKEKPKEECPGGTELKEDGPWCHKCPSGECQNLKTLSDGTYCLKCIEVDHLPPPEECPGGTEIEADGPYCSKCSSGSCENLKILSDGTYCLKCIAEDTGPQCPSGTTSDKGLCEDQCPADGVCVLDGDCYSCMVVQCPGGTSKDQGECQASCDGTCEVAASQHSVDCWQCKLDCDQTCAQNGYNPGETDYTNQILAELNGHQCVSGAGISITTATLGDCFCTKDPVISIDTTPPVCRGTPCGDVECNNSASCTQGDTTYTVTCNWGGWEKFAPNQFRPVLNAGGQ